MSDIVTACKPALRSIWIITRRLCDYRCSTSAIQSIREDFQWYPQLSGRPRDHIPKHPRFPWEGLQIVVSKGYVSIFCERYTSIDLFQHGTFCSFLCGKIIKQDSLVSWKAWRNNETSWTQRPCQFICQNLKMHGRSYRTSYRKPRKAHWPHSISSSPTRKFPGCSTLSHGLLLITEPNKRILRDSQIDMMKRVFGLRETAISFPGV